MDWRPSLSANAAKKYDVILRRPIEYMQAHAPDGLLRAVTASLLLLKYFPTFLGCRNLAGFLFLKEESLLNHCLFIFSPNCVVYMPGTNLRVFFLPCVPTISM